MNEAEKALLKAFAHEIADDLLPKLIEAEVSRIPAPYGPLVGAIVSAIKPSLIAQMDALIDSKLGA